MTNEEYFYSLLSKEEIERLPYLPTMGEFVDWFTKEYADNPAISDMTNTITYKELGERVARRRAFIEGLGLQKGVMTAVFFLNQDAVGQSGEVLTVDAHGEALVEGIEFLGEVLEHVAADVPYKLAVVRQHDVGLSA